MKEENSLLEEQQEISSQIATDVEVSSAIVNSAGKCKRKDCCQDGDDRPAQQYLSDVTKLRGVYRNLPRQRRLFTQGGPGYSL